MIIYHGITLKIARWNVNVIPATSQANKVFKAFALLSIVMASFVKNVKHWNEEQYSNNITVYTGSSVKRERPVWKYYTWKAFPSLHGIRAAWRTSSFSLSSRLHKKLALDLAHSRTDTHRYIHTTLRQIEFTIHKPSSSRTLHYTHACVCNE